MNDKTYDDIAKSLFQTLLKLRLSFKVNHGFQRSMKHEHTHKCHSPMTPGQFMTIMVLSEHGAMPISRLAKMINTTKPNMTMLVDRMEASGFVERRGNEKDRRVVEIALTDKARQGMEGHKVHVLKHYRQFLMKLDEPDVQRLSELAEEMAEIFAHANKDN